VKDYMQVDDWIATEEARQARVRRLVQPRRRRRQRDAEVLGFPVPIERPDPPAEPTTRHAELLERIDTKVAEIRSQGGKHLVAGRRAALLADLDLAGEVRQLCIDTSTAEALQTLAVSRQALQDVWLRHGLKAPRHSYR